MDVQTDEETSAVENDFTEVEDTNAAPETMSIVDKDTGQKDSLISHENSSLEQHNDRIFDPNDIFNKARLNTSDDDTGKDPYVVKVGSFQCDECLTVFRTFIDLCRHLFDHPESKPSYCNNCGTGFINQRQFQAHKHRKENAQVEMPFECDQCLMGFTTSHLLHFHKEGHRKPDMLHCDKCDKKFSSDGHAFLMDLRLHAAEKTKSSVQKIARCKSTVFSCNVCNLAYKSPSSLFVHLKSHSGGDTYICFQCGSGFDNLHGKRRRKHKEKHNLGQNKLNFQCEICKNCFLNSELLELHKETHSGKKLFECYGCHKEFSYGPNLYFHMYDPTFKCQSISKNQPSHQQQQNTSFETFFRQSIADNMISSEGNVPNTRDEFPLSCDELTSQAQRIIQNHRKDIYKCANCEGEFNTFEQIFNHLKEHGYPKFDICAVCGLGIKSEKLFMKHKLYHSSQEEEKFLHQCNVCDMEFLYIDLLILHVCVTHKGRALLYCEKCNLSFDSKGDFSRHNNSVMHKKGKALNSKRLSTYSRNLQCDFCHLQFKTRKKLYDHVNLKHYLTCHICEKNFETLIDFKSHKKQHPEDYPFRCGFCENVYRDDIEFVHHLNIHIKRADSGFFVCIICSRQFEDEQKLEEHKKEHEYNFCTKCWCKQKLDVNFEEHVKKCRSDEVARKIENEPEENESECEERPTGKRRKYKKRKKKTSLKSVYAEGLLENLYQIAKVKLVENRKKKYIKELTIDTNDLPEYENENRNITKITKERQIKRMPIANKKQMHLKDQSSLKDGCSLGEDIHNDSNKSLTDQSTLVRNSVWHSTNIATVDKSLTKNGDEPTDKQSLTSLQIETEVHGNIDNDDIRDSYDGLVDENSSKNGLIEMNKADTSKSLLESPKDTIKHTNEVNCHQKSAEMVTETYNSLKHVDLKSPVKVPLYIPVIKDGKIQSVLHVQYNVLDKMDFSGKSQLSTIATNNMEVTTPIIQSMNKEQLDRDEKNPGVENDKQTMAYTAGLQVSTDHLKESLHLTTYSNKEMFFDASPSGSKKISEIKQNTKTGPDSRTVRECLDAEQVESLDKELIVNDRNSEKTFGDVKWHEHGNPENTELSNSEMKFKDQKVLQNEWTVKLKKSKKCKKNSKQKDGKVIKQTSEEKVNPLVLTDLSGQKKDVGKNEKVDGNEKSCGKDLLPHQGFMIKNKSANDNHETSIVDITMNENEIFLCSHCDKGFSNQTHLFLHVYTSHKGIVPFVCLTCGYGYMFMSKAGSIQNHKKKHEKEPNKFPFKCTDMKCSERFKNEQLRTIHYKVHHLGERFLQCDLCFCPVSQVAAHFFNHYRKCLKNKYSHLSSIEPSATCSSKSETFHMNVKNQLGNNGESTSQMSNELSQSSNDISLHVQSVPDSNSEGQLKSQPKRIEQRFSLLAASLQNQNQDRSHKSSTLDEQNSEAGQRRSTRKRKATKKMIGLTQPVEESLDVVPILPNSNKQKATEKMIGRTESTEEKDNELNPELFNFFPANFLESTLGIVVSHQPKVKKKEGIFNCEICGDGFETYRELILHLYDHCGNGVQICLTCGNGNNLTKYKTKQWRKSHKQKHHLETLLYSCEMCSEKFARSEFLEMHKKTHQGRKLINCEHCNADFYACIYYVNHIRQNSCPKLKKQVHHGCSDQQQAKGELCQHLDDSHREKTDFGETQSCGDANKKSKTSSALRREKKIKLELKLKRFKLLQKKFKQARKRLSQKPSCNGITCKVCKRFLKFKSFMCEHSSLDLYPDAHICQKCRKIFSSGSLLKNHMIRSHSEDKMQCTICGSAFGSVKLLEYHLQKIHNIMVSKDGNHLQNNKTNDFDDHNYSKMELALPKLSNTVRYVPSDTSLKLESINNQDKSSIGKTRNVLKEGDKIEDYIIQQEGTFICRLCGKVLRCKKNKCAIHVKLAHGDKKLICTYCNKRFALERSLKDHLVNVHHFSPVKCKLCGKILTSSRGATTHLERVHRDQYVKEKKFKCYDCGEMFFTSEDRKFHSQIFHSKYKCDICGQVLASRRGLRKHKERKHQNYSQSKTPIKTQSRQLLSIEDTRRRETWEAVSFIQNLLEESPSQTTVTQQASAGSLPGNNYNNSKQRVKTEQSLQNNSDFNAMFPRTALQKHTITLSPHNKSMTSELRYISPRKQKCAKLNTSEKLATVSASKTYQSPRKVVENSVSNCMNTMLSPSQTIPKHSSLTSFISDTLGMSSEFTGSLDKIIVGDYFEKLGDKAVYAEESRLERMDAVCDKRLVEAESMTVDNEVTTDEYFICDECGLLSLDKLSLAKHKKIFHKKTLYNCNFCGVVVDSVLKAGKHRRRYHKKIKFNSWCFTSIPISNTDTSDNKIINSKKNLMENSDIKIENFSSSSLENLDKSVMNDISSDKVRKKRRPFELKGKLGGEHFVVKVESTLDATVEEEQVVETAEKTFGNEHIITETNETSGENNGDVQVEIENKVREQKYDIEKSHLKKQFDKVLVENIEYEHMLSPADVYSDEFEDDTEITNIDDDSNQPSLENNDGSLDVTSQQKEKSEETSDEQNKYTSGESLLDHVLYTARRIDPPLEEIDDRNMPVKIDIRISQPPDNTPVEIVLKEKSPVDIRKSQLPPNTSVEIDLKEKSPLQVEMLQNSNLKIDTLPILKNTSVTNNELAIIPKQQNNPDIVQAKMKAEGKKTNKKNVSVETDFIQESPKKTETPQGLEIKFDNKKHQSNALLTLDILKNSIIQKDIPVKSLVNMNKTEIPSVSITKPDNSVGLLDKSSNDTNKSGSSKVCIDKLEKSTQRIVTSMTSLQKDMVGLSSKGKTFEKKKIRQKSKLKKTTQKIFDQKEALKINDEINKKMCRINHDLEEMVEEPVEVRFIENHITKQKSDMAIQTDISTNLNELLAEQGKRRKRSYTKPSSPSEEPTPKKKRYKSKDRMDMLVRKICKGKGEDLETYLYKIVGCKKQEEELEKDRPIHCVIDVPEDLDKPFRKRLDVAGILDHSTVINLPDGIEEADLRIVNLDASDSDVYLFFSV